MASGNYGKRPLWQWILIYVLVGGLIYGLVYYFYFAKKGNPYGTNTGSPSSTSAVATSSVEMKSLAFNPGSITVKKGTTVTWTNNDSTAHTVTESDGQTGPSSANLSPGQTYFFTFDTVGTFHYYCKIHGSMMTGSVTVTADTGNQASSAPAPSTPSSPSSSSNY